MNKNNSFLKRTRLLWLCLIGMLATTQFAVASDLWDAGPGTVDASNIKSGYIIVTFPIFDGDGRDEGAAPNSYLSLVDASNNSYTILNIDGNQEDQKDSWTNFWTKAYRHYNNTTCVIAATIYGEKTVGTSSGEQLWFGSTQVNKSPHSMAKFTVYLSQSLLNSGKTFTPKFHLRVDINDGADYDEDHTTSSFNAPIFGSPTISSTTNSTRAGQYDIAFNVSDFSAGQYRFSNEATATTLSSSNKTVTLPLTKNTQDLTLYYWHKLTDACSNTMWIERSVKVTVPAYQKAENFTASNTSAADNTNADTKLTWTISGDASADYGSFEIQRSTDEGFATNVKSFSIGYSSTPYELIDRTSEENINGTVYYRISRLTPSGWKFDPAVTQTAKITKTMSHKGIKAGSVTEEIDAANKVTVKWDFDTGNVISDKSKIVIQRVQLENQKTDLTELDYEATKKSYTEEINAMCKEYHYNVYIKPGNTKYNVQEPVEAKLAAGSPQIVPTNFGNISSLIASKGYFSDRVELEWKLVDGAAETFSIQRREYGSTSDDDYKQLDTKPAFESAQQYTYTDVTSTPGIIYEYRVAGMTSCATGLSTVYSPAAVGFRTPTGDFYGRVTFENGQPEKDVQINVTTEDEIDAHALQIAAGQTATVNNADLLKNATAAATLQAFVSSTSANGDIIAKNGAYILGINNDNYFFTAGDKTLTLNINSLKASAQLGAFVQITGVYTGSELILYINGDSVASLAGAAIVPSNTNIVTFGGNNFAGKIDEVRIWDKALTPADIKRDYNRYLVGNEAGLIAYYTFNYATNIEFYDISYHGTTYNANHGKLNTTALTIATPSIEQLGYKGITREDGSYEVRSVPYKGNGTAYYLVPKLGANHEFESRSEVRFLNAQAQSHTVNFIDKSSFKVTGRVLYAGGTVPVKGVQFQVDGITVMNRGNVVTTDNSGEFEILVPIGVHEVKAVKVNHTFENGGKITDPNGNDLNYQDEKRGVELTDNTTIRFIGRIAGGTQQESYPLGHSLSTNNLGDGVTLTLKYDNDAYRLYGSPSAQPAQDSIFTVAHYRGTHAVNFNIPADSTTVRYTADGRSMIVQPSKTTGEFAVNVIPEDDFTLKLNVPGYTGFEDITIAGGRFANSVIEQFEKHEVEKDSVYSMELGKYKPIAAYTDEAPYYSKLNFSVRTRADMAVAQAKGSDVSSTVPYFGLEKYVISDLVGNKDTITLWNENGYTFAPNAIYEQGKTTLYKISLYEPYPYNDADGKNPSKTDKVPVQKSDIKISNALAKDTTIVTDTAGVAVYKFTAAGIDPGKPEQRIDITMKDNANVKWGFDVICIGAKNEGNDFVTNGPSNVLMVLRDPPGSQSQSFLEAGLKVTKSSTYSGSLSQVGNEELITSAGATTLTMTGAPGAMTGGTIEAENDAGFKLEHEEKYTGEDKEETSYTTTIKYSTSADPGMVGADADIYIGESTNLLFSRTTTVNFVNKSKYDPNLQKQLLESTDDNWKLVQASGLGVAQQFATTFAYSQQHIIDVLIPQLEEARSNVLGKFAYNTYKDYTDAQLQTLANDLKELVIVSKLPTDAPDYGQSNTTDLTDRYRWFYPATYTATTGRIGTDTIQAINQSIKRWEDAIAKNEQAKVYAIENREKCLLKNYSFQGGADIEYSEAYSTTNEHTSSFEVTIDIKAFGWIETKVFGSGVTLKLEEGGATVQSGNTSSSAGREHTKGFTLSDNASDNYLSVDVFNEPKWNAKSNSYEAWTREDEKYEDGNLSEGMVDEKDITAKSHFSTFIFSTRGGATSCPYEDEAVTKYFEPGKVISEKTIQIEQPGIIIAPTTLINVPSGKSGNFKLTMYNNATYKTDIETELLIDNASNTRGLKFYIDGAPIGNGRYFVIPAGSTVEKTLEVLRGVDMQYDDVKLILKSVCDNIADTINFNIHFTPSCTDINLRKPTTAWVYNTKLDTLGVNGVPEHYLNVTIDGFDQNYDNFHHIELQRKTASQSDVEWKPLASFYANDSIFAADSTAVGGEGVDKIRESDRGSIFYKLFMDGQLDQRYDIRAVSVCMVNGQPLSVDKVTAESEIHSGIKDMYNPRLFGAAQPADGVLDVEDEIRLNFNEPIAEGLLTKDNFQVLGIRNGTVSDHSTSVRFDGIDDYMDTEFAKNLTGKDLTIEMWIQPDLLQNATLFSQGNINQSVELSLL
ncbi:MAG: LamG domain-containing protein, partial [Prevotellaceae bacterium]|nr:LamG domain-containing protein [Prevotellaceae bacterium]